MSHNPEMNKAVHTGYFAQPSCKSIGHLDSGFTNIFLPEMFTTIYFVKHYIILHKQVPDYTSKIQEIRERCIVLTYYKITSLYRE